MGETIIKVKDFRKVYGNFVAVDGISFEVKEGGIFGILGPNGAGKTSTLECLEGLRQPDGGTMQIDGFDAVKDSRKLRNIMGVQLQASGLPSSITVEEAMKFFCAYHGVEPRCDLLGRFNLGEKLKTQFSGLSTGQQRRLALAIAVAHNPKLLILDEPTAGLDVASRVELHSVMNELKEKGTTILLATHDMAEAEKMVDKVAILLKGKIVASGSPKEITATGAGLTKISVNTVNSCLVHFQEKFAGLEGRKVEGEYVVYQSKDPGPAVSQIISYINEKDDTLVDLRVERPSLEERFLEITGGGAA